MMKRWIVVPMSLLAGMAASPVAKAPYRCAAMSAREVSQCLARLELMSSPNFDGSKPCVLSGHPNR